MAMLEPRILFAQNAEFCRLNHQDLRYRGRVPMVEQMSGFGARRKSVGQSASRPGALSYSAIGTGTS